MEPNAFASASISFFDLSGLKNITHSAIIRFRSSASLSISILFGWVIRSETGSSMKGVSFAICFSTVWMFQ